LEQLGINQKQLVRSKRISEGRIYSSRWFMDVKATVASNNQNTLENTLLISKLSLAQLYNWRDFESFDVVDDTNIKDENNIMAQIVSMKPRGAGNN
jgi:outer membrane protein